MYEMKRNSNFPIPVIFHITGQFQPTLSHILGAKFILQIWAKFWKATVCNDCEHSIDPIVQAQY